MPRRVDLPGAAELFRATADRTPPRPATTPPAGARSVGEPPKATGRVKHDEKITVYVSSEELLALEQLRLTLRAEHGVAVDRGRIVRAAIAEALADVHAHGGDARLIQRLLNPYGTRVSTFTVTLTNFTGPFDLLLQLITRHKLDVTEVALSKVTDEFIAHVRLGQTGEEPWDLEQTTSFLVVAATLLDLKAARLLPQGEVEDPEDYAILEARDLLFARLLQYRAFKEMAALFSTTLDDQGRRHAHPGGLEEHFRRLLPEVELNVDPEQFAWLAARAMAPREALEISFAHLHAPKVSVAEQADVIVDRLRRLGATTFRSLVADAEERGVVVARFLALLELARRRAVAFEQLTPLGELTVRWTGAAEGEVTVTDDYDDPQPPDMGPGEGEGP